MKPIVIFQNCEVESAGLIDDYLAERSLPAVTVRTFAGASFPRANDLAAAVVLGTPVSVREYAEYDHLKRLFAFMSEAVRFDLPLLGICFGGQMLARVLGARVERNPQREIGIYPIRLTEAGVDDPLFRGFPPTLEVFQWHGDTFRVPHGAVLLAEGDTCRNQAFRKNRAVAIQFHVEARPEEVPAWCDAYAGELAEEGLTKKQIVSAFLERQEQLRRLAFALMDNFLV